jgi:hypothetical protein
MAATVLPPGVAETPSELLAEIARLVSADDIPAAQAATARALECWPDDPNVRHWRRVLLDPPNVRLGVAGGTTTGAEIAWIREHGASHPGCWLAVKGCRLIAADPDYRVVRAAVAAAPENAGALYYHQPRPEDAAGPWV